MQLTIPELEAARDFLKQAETIVAAVRGIFLTGAYTEGATRAGNIGGRPVGGILFSLTCIQCLPELPLQIQAFRVLGQGCGNGAVAYGKWRHA